MARTGRRMAAGVPPGPRTARRGARAAGSTPRAWPGQPAGKPRHRARESVGEAADQSHAVLHDGEAFVVVCGRQVAPGLEVELVGGEDEAAAEGGEKLALPGLDGGDEGPRLL